MIKRTIVIIFILSSIMLCSANKRSNAKGNEVSDYTKGRELYENKKYEEAYSYFNTLSTNTNYTVINDYVLYYLSQSALNQNMYAEAIAGFYNIEKKYPTSMLHGYARQYRVLAEFYMNNYPVTNFFESKEPKWIKEFVGVRAMNNIYRQNKDIALNIATELIDRYNTLDAILFYDRYFRALATNRDKQFLAKMGRELYRANSYRDAGIYYNIIKDDKLYKEDSLYFLARISQITANRENATLLFDEYLKNKEYIKHRKDALYYMAENYFSLKDNVNAESKYKTLIAEYKNDNYIPRALRRLILNELRRGNFKSAKEYLTISLKDYRDSTYTDISARNYLRYSFNNKEKAEAYYALNIIKDLYKTKRPDYSRSWAIWVYHNFEDEKNKDAAIMDALLHTKNPHYIKEALTFASESMLKNISSTNQYYYEEAKNYYDKKNYSSAMSMLNKVQFIDYIDKGEYTPLLKDVRTLAHAMMTNKPFLQNYYSNIPREDLLKELTVQTKSNNLKAIALYNYQDYDNAYNEYKNAIKNIPITYPVFYFAKDIYSAALNTREYFSFSYRIGENFGYNYQLNVFLLPDEMATYIYPRYFDEYVLPEAKHYNIEPAFVYSIMREESLFDVKAKSHANAYGLMQLIKSTADMENKLTRYKFDPLNLNDPKQNIFLGTAHLSALFKNEGNSNYMIVAANYNAGSSNGRKWKERFGTTNMYYTSRLIDFDETEYYIERVMKSYEYYKLIYKDF